MFLCKQKQSLDVLQQYKQSLALVYKIINLNNFIFQTIIVNKSYQQKYVVFQDHLITSQLNTKIVKKIANFFQLTGQNKRIMIISFIRLAIFLYCFLIKSIFYHLQISYINQSFAICKLQYLYLALMDQQTPTNIEGQQFQNNYDAQTVLSEFDQFKQKAYQKKIKVEEYIINQLLEIKQEKGIFSPKINEFLIANIQSKPTVTKLKKIYTQMFLFQLVKTSVEEHTQIQAKIIYDLIQIIQNKDKVKLQGVLNGKFQDQQIKREIFSKIQLLFPKQPQSQNQKKEEPQKMINQADQQVQTAFNEQNNIFERQLDEFKDKMTKKKVTIQNEKAQNIIKNLLQFGSYSNQVNESLDDCSQILPIRNKVKKIFCELYRIIILTQEINLTIQENGYDQTQKNQIKQLISDGDVKIVQNWIKGHIQFQTQQQESQFLQKLMSLRNPQAKGENFLKKQETNKIKIKKNHQNKISQQTQMRKRSNQQFMEKSQSNVKQQNNQQQKDKQIKSIQPKQLNKSKNKQKAYQKIQNKSSQVNSSKLVSKQQLKKGKSQKKYEQKKQDKMSQNYSKKNMDASANNYSNTLYLNHSIQYQQKCKQLQVRNFQQADKFKSWSNNNSRNNDYYNYNQGANQYNHASSQQFPTLNELTKDKEHYPKKYESAQNIQNKFYIFLIDRECFDLKLQTSSKVIKNKQYNIQNQIFNNKWQSLVIFHFKVVKNQNFSIVFRIQKKKNFFISFFTSSDIEHIHVNNFTFQYDSIFNWKFNEQKNVDKLKQMKENKSFLIMLAILFCLKILDKQQKYLQMLRFLKKLMHDRILFKSNCLIQDLHRCRNHNHNNNKIQLTDIGSKIVVLFFSQDLQFRNKLLRNSQYQIQLSYLTKFESVEANNKKLDLPQFHEMQYLKIILNIMFQQLNNNLSVNQKCFMNYFKACYLNLSSFSERLNFLYDLSQTSPKIAQSNYQNTIFDLIGNPYEGNQQNKRLMLGQYLILHLAVLNIRPKVNQNEQYRYQRINIINVFNLIRTFCQSIKLSQSMAKDQNKYINDIPNCNSQSEIFKQIFNGQFKNNHVQGYFLFANQSILELWTNIIDIKNKFGISFNNIFKQICGEHRIYKGFLQALKSQRSPQMIAFLLKYKAKGHLKDLFENLFKQKQIPYKQSKNALQLINLVFEECKSQNYQYFTELFIQILNKSKLQLNVKQMLNLLQIKLKGPKQEDKICLFLKIVLKQPLINLPTINELKQQLDYITKLKKDLKHIYLDQIGLRIKQTLKNNPNKDKILEAKAQQIIFSPSCQDEDKHYILKIIFTGISKSKDQLKILIFSSLKQTSKKLRVLTYYQNFKKALSQIIKEIQSKQIQYSTIKDIKGNKIIFFSQQNRQHFVILQQVVFNIHQQMQIKTKQINWAIKVLRSYQDKFEEQIQKFNKWTDSLNKTKVIQSIKNIKKFEQFLKVSEQIYKLMQIPLWNKDKIFNFPDLIDYRKQIIKQLQNFTEQFKLNKLTYVQFKKYFKVQILNTICQKVTDQKLKYQIQDYAVKLQDDFKTKVYQYVIAVNSIFIQIQNKEYFDNKTIQILKNIENADEHFQLTEAYKGIECILKLFKQIGFDLCKQNQLQRAILLKHQHKRVFQLIEAKKIDSVNLINDLNDFINDMEGSILKLQDLKQLENICKFNQMIAKSKTVEQFFKSFDLMIKKEWRISQNIISVNSKIKLIQQKIDQCSNRQTSFKYDLESIFKNSTFKIFSNNKNAQIQIQLPSSQQTSKYNFKKLTQFKDKALLLVIDFKKTAEVGIQMNQVIQIFNKYLQFFKIIEQINDFNQKIIIYGYNPNDLKLQIKIQHEHFKQLQQTRDRLKKDSQQWITGIKSLYDNSYILTHFIGPNLNSFVQSTLKYEYNPILKQILKIQQKQFKQKFDALYFTQINQKQKLSSLQKVQKVCKLFGQIQRKSLKSQFKQDQHMSQNTKKKHIQLISCSSIEDFYFALSKQQNIPEMNQVLYCQNQTSIEQIDIFLKRSMIKTSRKHYILGAHELKIEVQLNFCDLLSQYLQTRQQNFYKSKLCFIDNSTSEKLYIHLCKQELFGTQKINMSHYRNQKVTSKFIQSLANTFLIQSKIAGLGKTFQAQTKFSNSVPIYFSVAGNIDFPKLVQRLKKIQFSEKCTLILQIGHIQNKKKLQIFLFYLAFFKGFNYKEFFYIPKNTNLMIQIQNIYQEAEKQKSQYHILKIIKQNRKKYIFLQQFKVQEIQFDFQSIQQAFTLFYLKGIDTGQLNKREQSFSSFQQMFSKGKKLKQIVKKPQAVKYIRNFFYEPIRRKNQPTFWLYKSFIKLLFTSFKTFSQNGCFNVQTLQYNHRSNKSLRLDEVRINFLRACISNCIQFLEATINTNQFQEKQKQLMSQGANKSDFRSKLSQFPFLIMPASDFQNYQFVYLDSSEVDDSIKSMLVSQKIYQYIRFNKFGYQKTAIQRKLNLQMVSNLFSSDSLQQLKNQQLQRQIFRILHQLSGNNDINIPDKLTVKQFKEDKQSLRNYSITLDNFFKMCLIVQRAVSHIPIIIMGQSGVGKTALIKFLVQQIFKHQFFCFNVHAGVNQQTLIAWYSKLKQTANECGPNIKVWGFFDQFNTTDELSYIKQMLIDRRFQGQKIADNIILLGACNPYRKKNIIKSQKRAGIMIKSVKKDDKLAFRVNPPPLSMIQFMWDYQQLLQNENKAYISKILQSLHLSNHETVVKVIAQIHEFFKKEYQISSVSLRDVTRFKQLYQWFLDYMPVRPDNCHYKKEQINPNYQMNQEQRAISLSLSFCYSLRIANRKERSCFLAKVTQNLDYEHQLQQVVKNQQTDYVNRLKISDQKIAVNFSLRQNVFTTLVCLINKIPILIIGNPGNSKSLSIRMISSNLTGENSNSQFCRQFPQINMIYFQGSETCTSKGIQGVFQKAIKSYQQFKKKDLKGVGKVQNCILFDQIGLAQKSIHNPLKVLHSELETNKKQICFIGISNWELDAAKMSRFLVLSRATPQKQQLQDTSVKILASYLPKTSVLKLQYESDFKQMAEWYFKFIKKWDKQHQDEDIQGFFGLRDFYCYIKYVAQKILQEEQGKRQKGDIKQYMKEAVMINFDGQKDSVKMFLQICSIEDNQVQYVKDPVKLVKNNLQSASSRCLLLIVRGDALIPIIQSKINVNGVNSKIQCIYGSTFKADQQSQQYNLEITSMIISHISRGNILAFKDINNSIQTSMYDLFNKSFTVNSNKKYCRIAVGANSNPKCLVHPNFNSIVFIDQEKIKQTDLAFLNRFQKHYLNLGSVLNQYQKDIVTDIKSWIDTILRFKSKTELKKQQNYLINSCQQSIVTLIIKYSQSDTPKMMRNIKKTLLKNSTTDFRIALQEYIQQNFKKQILQLFDQIKKDQMAQSKNMIQQQSFQDIIEQPQKIQDKIIYTYDQQINSIKQVQQQDRNNIFKIRISQTKSQKQLRNQLKIAFLDQSSKLIHILLDYQRQWYHVNMVIFLALQIKKQFPQLQKPVYIIIQLSRSSFTNMNRDSINVSYLHKFQQCFIQNLSQNKKNNQNSFQQKSLKQLYFTLRMENSFINIYTQAMKRFKLILNQDRVKLGNIDQMQSFYFQSAIEVAKIDVFKNRVLNFIQDNLSDQKIDLKVLLNSKQDIKECHNIEEGVQRYLQGKVINLICCFLDRVYKNNLLYCFNLQKTFELYKSQNLQIQVLKSTYERQQQNYHKFLSSLIDKYVVNKSLKVKQYKRKFQSNPLQIQQVSLFPMSPKDFAYIYSTKQDSLTSLSGKLLSLHTNKNQDQDASQQYNMLIDKCYNLIDENSIFLKHSPSQKQNFEDILDKNLNLQYFYFFDLINNLFSKTINSDVFPLERVALLFIYTFREQNIKRKIILLTLSQQLWSYIFNIWSLWISFNQKGFHKQILQFYSDKLIDTQYDLPQKLIQICKYTLQFQEQMFCLKEENIGKYGIKIYLQYFKKTYFYNQKLRIYCMDMQIEVSQTLKATKRFFDLLDKILDKQQIQQNIVKFILIKKESFQEKIQTYLHQILLKQPGNKANVNAIITYLSLDIYSAWIQRLIVQKNQSQLGQITSQMKTCFFTFFKYTNTYPQFANNTTFFLQKIFQQFVQELGTIQQKIDYLTQMQNDIICLLEQQITFDNNFSVALGNFFMNDIETAKQQFQDNQETQFKDQMAEQKKNSFLSSYLNYFKDFIQQDESSNIVKVFQIQFCKIYLNQYLQFLETDSEPHLLAEIDKVLCRQNKKTSLLRLFLLKVMLYQQKSMNNIKNNYLLSNKCKWLDTFKQIIQGKSFQILVPPGFQDQQRKILQMIGQFRLGQYQDYQLFEQILQQSFVSPFAKYEFLNFMMNDLYTRSCPEDRIVQILQIIQKCPQYQQENEIQFTLLKCYCRHQINSVFRYEMGIAQLKIQQFVEQQLTFINYINVFISCNKFQCPLIQMFFNKKGSIPKNYFDWIQARFLILGKQNLSCSILNGILQRNDISSGYYRCSSQCDFFYVIGGTGYGCKNPSVRSVCPWCKKGLGGVGDKLDRIAQGAKQYIIRPDGTQLTQIRQQIRQKHRIQVLKLKLNGYGYSANPQTVLKQIQQNNRISYSPKALLEQMFLTIWSFLVDTKFISKDDAFKIFGDNSENISQKFIDISKKFNTDLGKRLNFEQESTNIIWHLGMSKQILKFIVGYKSNLTAQKQGFMGLVKCKGRDMVEEQISKIVLSFSSGKQKEDLVNKSRTIKSGVNLSGQQIVRQTDGNQKHQQKYPQIRMIKLIHKHKSPNFQNLINQYGEIIQRDYPILSYCISKQQKIQKLLVFRKIYLFVSKLIKTLNYKITRKDAITKSITKIISDIVKQDSQVDNSKLQLSDIWKQQIKQFCDLWNQLRNEKFQLQYDCHNFGSMDQATIKLDINSPAINFLPDNKYKGDQKGQMLLSFLQVSARQYNIVCTQIQNVRKSSHKYRQTDIFNPKQINPTQIQPLIRTLEMSGTKIQEDFIFNFSSSSVQYGVTLPHYSIQKIQSLIVENMVGSHILSEQIKDYQTNHYIGQQTHFINQIRSFEEQISWESLLKRQQIQTFVYTLKHNSPDSFIKQINALKGSLQKIMMYYKYKRAKVQPEQSLGKFISENTMILPSKLIQKQMFSCLPLKSLLSVYEFIELHTLENSASQLNQSYKKEAMTERQVHALNQFKDRIRQNFKAETNIIYHISVALYRFVCRKLLLVQVNEEMNLYDFISEGEQLWPKQFDLQKLKEQKQFEEAFSIKLSKVGNLLLMVPFELKKTKAELVMIDNEKQLNNINKRRPQTINQGAKPGKKKKNL